MYTSILHSEVMFYLQYTYVYIYVYSFILLHFYFSTGHVSLCADSAGGLITNLLFDNHARAVMRAQRMQTSRICKFLLYLQVLSPSAQFVASLRSIFSIHAMLLLPLLLAKGISCEGQSVYECLKRERLSFDLVLQVLLHLS